MDLAKGLLFDNGFQRSLKDRFYFVDHDPAGTPRLFFENSGGSLRLKAAVEAKTRTEQLPDCPERSHEQAFALNLLVQQGTRDILSCIFAAEKGALITELTASQAMFHMVELVMENIPGTNAVVSVLEHPSAFDAVAYYCQKTGKELRVIPADPATGAIDPDTAASFVDENTCLLSVMSASNVTGAIMDIGAIVRKAREKKPDLYILTDAVQHAPHCALDAQQLQVDGINIGPYKFFGVRGCGFAWISDRMAQLPHRKLLAREQTVFALGTPAPGNFAAMTAVIDYVCRIGAAFCDSGDRRTLYRAGMERIHLQERALLHRLLEGTDELPGLRHIPGVIVYADALELSRRDLIVAMGIDGMDVTDAVKAYERRGVIVCDRSNRSIYAKRIVESLGLEGAIRVSPLHCHAADDIDRFLRITAELAGSAGKTT